MYIPPHFAQTDPGTLHAFIERHSFGLLVSDVDGVPFATHLPFLLDRSAGPHGTLIGHLARANPHAQAIEDRVSLAVFSGPHAYVSPTWYAAEHTVPTWNYTAVHAYGRASPIADRTELLDLLQRSVAVYEADMPRPWVLDLSSAVVDRLISQIVGFRLSIDRLEGKWKLSQNHPVGRRERVIAALQGGSGDAPAVAELMRAALIPQGR